MRRNRTIDAEFFYGATPEIFLRAAELRKNMTFTEKLVWNRLNNKKLLGLNFRRQHPINQFITDSYCHKARLAIEIDGSIHKIDGNKEKDSGRENEFMKFGLTTIRFTNDEVLLDIDMIINKIKTECINKVPHLGDLGGNRDGSEMKKIIY